MNSVHLTIDQIDQVFEDAEEQADYIIGLHKLLYPNWDDITKLQDFPACTDFLWRIICLKAQSFDTKHHPEVLPGGAWLNNGFTVDRDESLSDFEVKPAEYI